jgi:hypothetical protein
MVRSIRKRIGAALLCTGLVTLGFGFFAGNATAKPGDTVDFVAAGPGTYDHADGEGIVPTYGYGDRDISKTEGVVESLEGGDFDCADTVVFFTRVSAAASQVSGGQIEFTQLFARETTGHKNGTPALGYGEPVSVDLLAADTIAHSDTNGDGDVTFVPVPAGGDNVEVAITVTGLDEGDVFIVRTKVEIVCDPLVVAKDNTGNLHASLDLANAGAQTVPMKSAANVITEEDGAFLAIVKDASPNVAQDFTFTSTGAADLDPDSFSLDDDDDATLENSERFGPLDDGDYAVTEGAPTGGYSLSGLACVETGTTTPFTGATTSTATRTASVSLVSGDDVTCTFTNTFQSSCPDCGPSFGSLTVRKEVVNGVGGETFAFTAVCGSTTSNFNLGDGQSTTLFDIPLGTTCTVTEVAGVDTATVTWSEGVQDSDGGGDGVVVINGAESAAFTNARTEVQAAVVEQPTTTTAAPTTTVAPPAPTVKGVTLARTGVETQDLMVMAGFALALGGLLLGWSETSGRRSARERA